jgi:hypothetical protein
LPISLDALPSGAVWALIIDDNLMLSGRCSSHLAAVFQVGFVISRSGSWGEVWYA